MSKLASDPALFFRLWLKDPFKIGAIAPSSPELARAMANQVPNTTHYPIVELGGGTGAITSALLERGVAPEKLIVVERDPTLHDLLQKRFPKVNVVQGDAAHLGALLHPHGISKVSAVVSGLPLLGLPQIGAAGDRGCRLCALGTRGAVHPVYLWAIFAAAAQGIRAGRPGAQAHPQQPAARQRVGLSPRPGSTGRGLDQDRLGLNRSEA